jgi:hypothetical protein
MIYKNLVVSGCLASILAGSLSASHDNVSKKQDLFPNDWRILVQQLVKNNAEESKLDGCVGRIIEDQLGKDDGLLRKLGYCAFDLVSPVILRKWYLAVLAKTRNECRDVCVDKQMFNFLKKRYAWFEWIEQNGRLQSDGGEKAFFEEMLRDNLIAPFKNKGVFALKSSEFVYYVAERLSALDDTKRVQGFLMALLECKMLDATALDDMQGCVLQSTKTYEAIKPVKEAQTFFEKTGIWVRP